MLNGLPQLELMRSETFPFPERFAANVSALGRLAYFDAGQNHAHGAGGGAPRPPVVLLHALGTNYTHWEYVAPELARHTRVVGLDLPGCGHSERPRGSYRLAELCESVRALLDYLKVERPILVGHSFGGRVAMELALAEPQRFSGLVLLNSAGLTRYPAALSTLGQRLLGPKILGTLMLALAPLFLPRIFGKKTARCKRFMAQIYGRIDLRAPYDFAAHAYPLLPDLVSDVLDRLPELTLPMQVLLGERDGLVDREVAERLLPVLSIEAELAIKRLSECGHMPTLECPEEVLASILALLARVEQRHRDASAERSAAANG